MGTNLTPLRLTVVLGGALADFFYFQCWQWVEHLCQVMCLPCLQKHTQSDSLVIPFLQHLLGAGLELHAPSQSLLSVDRPRLRRAGDLPKVTPGGARAGSPVLLVNQCSPCGEWQGSGPGPNVDIAALSMRGRTVFSGRLFSCTV